jgi:hypothetical protein
VDQTRLEKELFYAALVGAGQHAANKDYVKGFLSSWDPLGNDAHSRRLEVDCWQWMNEYSGDWPKKVAHASADMRGATVINLESYRQATFKLAVEIGRFINEQSSDPPVTTA